MKKGVETLDAVGIQIGFARSAVNMSYASILQLSSDEHFKCSFEVIKLLELVALE